MRTKLLNTPAPQTVTGPAVSAVIGCTDILLQATADCFICISPAGLGTDGNAVGPTNGHFIKGGGAEGYKFGGLNQTHKIGVDVGTIYISPIG